MPGLELQKLHVAKKMNILEVPAKRVGSALWLKQHKDPKYMAQVESTRSKIHTYQKSPEFKKATNPTEQEKTNYQKKTGRGYHE